MNHRCFYYRQDTCVGLAATLASCRQDTHHRFSPSRAESYLVIVGVRGVDGIWRTLEELPSAGACGSKQHVGKAEPESHPHHQCEQKLLREHQA